jgi:hypothetical protein
MNLEASTYIEPSPSAHGRRSTHGEKNAKDFICRVRCVAFCYIDKPGFGSGRGPQAQGEARASERAVLELQQLECSHQDFGICKEQLLPKQDSRESL